MSTADTPPDSVRPAGGARLVALDAMGVLYRSADDVADLLIPYARGKGSALSDQELSGLYIEASLGRSSSAQFWSRAGATGADDAEYCEGHELTEGLPAFLDALAATGALSACLSNDVAEWSLLLRRRFGLERRIGTWVISGEIGARKPDPAAFAALARRTGVPAADTLFVDDRPANLRAARACGLATVGFGPAAADEARWAPDLAALAEVVDAWM